MILSMRNLLLITIVLCGLGCKNLKRNSSQSDGRQLKASPGWDSLGAGIKGTINAMVVYNGDLYVGGRIDSAGNIPMHGIAMWDGHNWHSVGKGITGNVNALAVYHNELYAGGFFDSAGGKPYSCIAKWNGTKWSDVDTLNDAIAMTTFNNRLYATGFNDSSDEKTTHTIGSWDGAMWDSLLNPDKNWEIRALCTYNGNLYAAGRISGDSNLIVLARHGWSIIRKPFKFDVNTMLQFNSELYFGGSDVLGNGASHIIKWNGKAWNVPGSGLKGQVKSLAAYNGKLYAGGQFARVGNKYAGCLAMLNDTDWQAVGGGVNLESIELENKCPATESNLVIYVDNTPNKRGVIYYDTLFANISINAMAEYEGELYIGGKFDIAGGVPAQNIARYKEPAKLNQ